MHRGDVGHILPSRAYHRAQVRRRKSGKKSAGPVRVDLQGVVGEIGVEVALNDQLDLRDSATLIGKRQATAGGQGV